MTFLYLKAVHIIFIVTWFAGMFYIPRLFVYIVEAHEKQEPEKSILLESGLEELNAISWNKGCYIGQELTTRTKFQGLVRKRLFPVEIEGTPPSFGEEVFLNKISVGVMRSHAGRYGLALLRLEHLKSGQEELECSTALLKPSKPFWMEMTTPRAALKP